VGGAMSTRRPYIPAGCDQQGRELDGRRAMTHEEAARNAGMGMACHEATTSPADLTPLRAWPYAEHSRPGRLTEAELDRHNAERAERRPLPELLLAKGAMTAHPAPTWLERLRTAWLDFRIRRLGRL